MRKYQTFVSAGQNYKILSKITDFNVLSLTEMYFYNQTFSDFDNMSSQQKTCEILKTYLNYFMSKFINLLGHLKKLKLSLARKGLRTQK